MLWKRFIVFAFAVAATGVFFIYTFGRDPAEPSTARELAEVLGSRGIAYDSIANLNSDRWTFSDIDEGVTVTGDETYLEILRIEDAETFSAAETASARFGRFQGGIVFDPGKVTRVYTRRPFVVVIREEPLPGQVAAILKQVLPAGVG